MSALGLLLIGVFATLLGVAVGDLASEEIRGRLDQLPHGIVRLAARLLPEPMREDLRDEWRAELHEILRGAEALPVTRLVRGARYALGLLRTGRAIGHELSRISGQTSRGTAPRPMPIVDPANASTALLLAAANLCDQIAWDALVDRYARLVWSTARSFKLSAADSADVSQTTWLAVVEHLDEIRDPDGLASWLAITARRESLRLIRTNSGETTTFASPPKH